MKKLVSALIIMTMILTSLTVPVSVSASDATQEQTGRVLLEEDFESADGLNAFSANCTNVEYDETDDVSEHYGEIAYNSDGQIIAELNVEDVYSGTVRIGYDAYLLSNGNRPVTVIPASGGTSTDEYYLLQVFQREVHVKERVSGEQIYKASADGWVRVEQMVNLDTGVIQTELYDMTKTLLATGESTAGDSIGKIIFRNWGKSSAFKVDNIIVEICDPTPVEKNVFTEDFEGEDNQFDANCTNTKYDTEDENSEQYGAITATANTAGFIDFEDIYSGAVEISYDLYLQQNNRLIRAIDKDGNKIYILQATQNTVKTTNNGTAIIDTLSADSWVRIKQRLYLDKGIVWTQVYSGAELIGEIIYDAGPTSITKLEFNNLSSATTLRLDNISVDIINPIPEEATLFEETFEGETNNLSESCTNVTYDGITGKVGEIALSGTCIADFDSIYGGSVKIAYDAYLKDNNRLIRATDVSGNTYYLAQLMNKEVRFTDGTNVLGTPYDGASEGWIHIEHMLNFDTGVITTQVYSGGELVGEGEYEAGCDSITKIEIINKSPGAVFHMDNISVETVIDRPEVKDIIVYDIFGNKIENPTSAVNAITRVEIVFDENISSFNSSDYFVMKTGETTVETQGMLKDNVYTMTLKETLEYETTYTIEVSQNVIDTDGNASGLDYTTSLTTATLADTENDVKISSFTQAEDGTIAVDAGFINATGAKLNMIFMVAFYDADGRLIGINEPQTKDSANAYGSLSMTFDGYSGADTVSSTRLFYWDSLINMNPYGAVKEL